MTEPQSDHKETTQESIVAIDVGAGTEPERGLSYSYDPTKHWGHSEKVEQAHVCLFGNAGFIF